MAEPSEPRRERGTHFAHADDADFQMPLLKCA
jgi:hypothetical protein